MSNFNPIFNSDREFLDNRFARELMNDGLAWSTENMPDESLRMAIVADLLSFGVWNQEKKTKLQITFNELVRFVTPSDVGRIREQLEHEEIKHLITFKEDIYSLKEGREIYQAAMDYCGVWYDDYEKPDDVSLISVNHEAMNEAVKQYGSIENLALALAMDLGSQIQLPTSMN